MRASEGVTCNGFLGFALLRFELFCYVLLCFALLCFCFSTPCFAMLCLALLCYALLGFAWLGYAFLCIAWLCYALHCFAMLCFSCQNATRRHPQFMSCMRMPKSQSLIISVFLLSITVVWRRCSIILCKSARPQSLHWHGLIVIAVGESCPYTMLHLRRWHD